MTCSFRYVDALTSADIAGDSNVVPPIVCILEEPVAVGKDDKVKVSLISVCCSTGDVIWDSFEGMYPLIDALETFLTLLVRLLDNQMRTELEVGIRCKRDKDTCLTCV